MKRSYARLLLVVFTLVWGGWSTMILIGSTIGDCFDDVRCQGIKEYAPAWAMWRGIAVQCAALLLYALNSRLRKE